MVWITDGSHLVVLFDVKLHRFDSNKRLPFLVTSYIYWSQRAELNRRPTDYESESLSNQQLTTTNNNKRISVLAPLPLLSAVVENCHYLLVSGPFLAHKNDPPRGDPKSPLTNRYEGAQINLWYFLKRRCAVVFQAIRFASG